MIFVGYMVVFMINEKDQYFTEPQSWNVTAPMDWRRSLPDLKFKSDADFQDYFSKVLIILRLSAICDEREFFQAPLWDHSEHLNSLSYQLSTNDEVISEAQRIHFEIFGRLFAGARYAVLMDVADYENKGWLLI